MKILNFKDFMMKYNLRTDIMNESQLQIFFNYPIYPRDLKNFSDKAFVHIGCRRSGGSHWCVFYVKKNKIILLR